MPKYPNTVTLDKLIPNPANPRKTFDPSTVHELAASILANGVLQNLVVRPRAQGRAGATSQEGAAATDDHYEVVAGDRRLRALTHLRCQNQIPKSYRVPVVVKELSDSEALSLAITENAMREDVHPLEQADAFLQLADMGKTADEISVQMGVSERVVRQQMQLAAGISDTTREYYFADHLDLAQARALSSVSKHEQDAFLQDHLTIHYHDDDYEFIAPEGVTQNEDSVFIDAEGFEVEVEATLKPGATPYAVYNNIPDGAAIKRIFAFRHIPLENALFEAADYLNAGGTVTEDMFGTGHFNDTQLFMKLQREAAKKQLEQQGEYEVHLLDAEPNYGAYSYQAGHLLAWISSSGTLITRKDYGPQLKKTEAETPTKSAPQNKKRIRLEDKAVNRAVESALMDDYRLAMRTLVLTLLRVHGSRLGYNTPFCNPHDGYHDPRALSTAQGFYDRLKAKGLELTSETSKEGDPIKQLATGIRPGAPQGCEVPTDEIALAVLEQLNGQELSELIQALVTLSLTPVFDGQTTPMHDLVLRTAQPNLGAHFIRSEEYLKACKNPELEVIIAELGHKSFNANKKTNVEYISKLSEWPSYVPERFRPRNEEELEVQAA